MNRYVADTHALFWFLTDSNRLGYAAAQVFAEVSKGTAMLFVPSIVLAELYFLTQKLGLHSNYIQFFNQLRLTRQVIFVSFDAEDVAEFDQLSAVPEMHDRMIVGVARRMEATLLTRDDVITKSGIVTVAW